MLNDSAVTILKDYDVLGVGAARRARLQALAGSCTLQLHRGLVDLPGQPMYEALLAQTLGWLKPMKATEEKFLGSAENFARHLLVGEFLRCFPKTAGALPGGRAADFISDYLAEFPWRGPLLTDHLRYVPMCIQRRFQNHSLYVLAQKEWLLEYLSFADFGRAKSESGRVTVNPSLQTLHVSNDELIALYYDESSERVLENEMSVLDAAVVDKLQDDRKYTLDQLVDQVVMMNWSEGLASENVRKRVFFLKEKGILQLSDSKIL